MKGSVYYTICDSEHDRFYLKYMSNAKREDSYYKALFYTLGINPEKRNYIQDTFDFHNDRIKPDGLNEVWQTSGSLKTTLFVFNMWNGFSDESMPFNHMICSVVTQYRISLKYSN